MFFAKLKETFFVCSRLLPSKEFGFMIYSFGPAPATGSSLPCLSRPIPQRKNEIQKIKLLFVHFPYQDYKQSIWPRGMNPFIGKLEKAHTKLTNIVQIYGPTCEDLDGFYEKCSTHEIRQIRLPLVVFF